MTTMEVLIRVCMSVYFLLIPKMAKHGSMRQMRMSGKICVCFATILQSTCQNQECAAAKAPISCGSTGQHIFQVVKN